jgi:DNA-binding LytR/AlgR family response regulator
MKKIGIATLNKPTECFYPHEVMYLKGEGDYTHIAIAVDATTERKLTASNTIKHYERMLPPDKFIRTSKNFIVSLDFVAAIDGDTIILKKPATENATLSKEYKDNLDIRILK